MAAKLQDGADPLLPTGPLHALAWLVTGTSEAELATKLAQVCAILPLPEWCATLRRLSFNDEQALSRLFELADAMPAKAGSDTKTPNMQ